MNFINSVIDWWGDQNAKHERWFLLVTFLFFFVIYGVLEAMGERAFVLVKFIGRPASDIEGVINIVLLFALSIFGFYFMKRVQDKNVSDMKPLKFKVGNYVAKGRPRTIIFYVLFMYLAQIIVAIGIGHCIFNVPPNSGANEKAINQMIDSGGLSTVWILCLACFIGPCMEELLFRFLLIGPRNFRQRKAGRYVYSMMIIISIAFFVFEHVSGQMISMNWSSYVQVGQIITTVCQYLTSALIITLAYTKTSDVMNSLSIHIGLDVSLTLIQFASVFLF